MKENSDLEKSNFEVTPGVKPKIPWCMEDFHSPISGRSLAELKAGSELDSWLASFLKTQDLPYSTSWSATGYALQKMFQEHGHDFVGVTAMRWDKELVDGKFVNKFPPEKIWSITLDKEFEGLLISEPGIEGKLAIVKGMIFAFSAKAELEKRKTLES